MSIEQKQAWWLVATSLLALIVFFIVLCWVDVEVAWGAFGLVGFGGLGPLIFRKRKDENKVDFDERDRTIAKQATLGAGMTSYLAVILACMIPWFVYHHQGKETISIYYLPFIAFLAMIVLFLARSIIILLAYGREVRRDGD